MAKDSPVPDLPSGQLPKTVGGAEIPQTEGDKFIVRNNGRHTGNYLLGGKDFDLAPGAFVLLESEPRAVSFGLTIQKV